MKQLGWKWGAAAILALAPALTLTAAVRTDFDTRANFGRYRTFAWRDAGSADSLVDARIRGNAVEQLAARGLREDAESPDVLLSFRVDADTERTRTVVPGFGYRPFYRPLYWPPYRPMFGRHPGFRPMYRPYFGGGFGGGARVIESEFVEGRIQLEMVDARTNQTIWRADITRTGDSVLDVQSEKSIAKAMKDAFKKFPRKS